MSGEVALCWSGGLDSTYRLCQLSLQEVEVDLYYVMQRRCASMKYELAARKRILADLRGKRLTRATFVDHVLWDADISPMCNVDAAIGRINATLPLSIGLARHPHVLGRVWRFLSYLATEVPDIEVCIEGPDCPSEHWRNILVPYDGAMLFDERDVGRMNQKLEGTDRYTVFGNFSFPVLHVANRTMLDWMVLNGFMDVLSHVWFCYHPHNGMPCGICTSCKTKLWQGIDDFFCSSRARKNLEILEFLDRNYSPLFAEAFKMYVFGGNSFATYVGRSELFAHVHRRRQVIHSVRLLALFFRELQRGGIGKGNE